jgi:hypothetical protein
VRAAGVDAFAPVLRVAAALWRCVGSVHVGAQVNIMMRVSPCFRME